MVHGCAQCNEHKLFPWLFTDLFLYLLHHQSTLYFFQWKSFICRKNGASSHVSLTEATKLFNLAFMSTDTCINAANSKWPQYGRATGGFRMERQISHTRRTSASNLTHFLSPAPPLTTYPFFSILHRKAIVQLYSPFIVTRFVNSQFVYTLNH